MINPEQMKEDETAGKEIADQLQNVKLQARTLNHRQEQNLEIVGMNKLQISCLKKWNRRQQIALQAATIALQTLETAEASKNQ